MEQFERNDTILLVYSPSICSQAMLSTDQDEHEVTEPVAFVVEEGKC